MMRLLIYLFFAALSFQSFDSLFAQTQTAKPSKDTAAEYVIGVEDLLDIHVFELPQFSVVVRVAGDGTISLPLVGSIEVKGLSRKAAEQKVASALQAKYVNQADVSITIKEYKSRQASVLGAVKTPGGYPVIGTRTLLQILTEAGGLTPEAGRKCFIFREGAEKMEIDLDDLMKNGNQKLNVQVSPGDVISIPVKEKIVVYVLGAVRNPGAVELSTDVPTTLIAAIARAGGPTDQANQSGIQIKRKQADGEKVIKANLKDIMKGKTPDIELLAGDVIHVPESFF